jgi:serine/threonine protein kinase
MSGFWAETVQSTTVNSTVQPILCPYCTTPNPVNASACSNCGADLGDARVLLPENTRLREGQYVINGVLGRGGFGISYRATGARGAQVTVKELFPDGLVTRDADGRVNPKPGSEMAFTREKDRFEREADTLRRLRNRSKTRFLEIWSENGTDYIAMGFIEGEPLEARLQRGQRFSEAEALGVMHPVLDVLKEMHAHKLLHRDIKPGNIILGLGDVRRASVGLIDFGAAVAFTPGERVQLTTRLVTRQYAPLEQYGSQVELGPATDLYALGATIYEAVTGVPPTNVLERANGLPLEPIQNLAPGVSADFARLIERCLEMRVADRPRSASIVLAEVRRLERRVPRASRLRTQLTNQPRLRWWRRAVRQAANSGLVAYCASLWARSLNLFFNSSCEEP